MNPFAIKAVCPPGLRRRFAARATAATGVVGLLALALLTGGLLGAEPAAIPPAAARTVDFSRDIKPLFEASCVQCHARGKDKGGLSLENRDALLKGGDSGPALMLGNGGDSEIVKYVAGVDPENVMPKKGTRWTPEQVGLLRAWIDQGAPWDPLITFARPEPLNLKPRPVQLPVGNDAPPINRLLTAYFRANRIEEPAVVDDRAFARRAYLDVIGLLPTPSQLDQFLHDPSPGKRAALVRKLLDDKRGYADHWLTFWNDLLRNDYRGAGFIDGGRRQITGWLYAALLDNKPYDHFVAELVNPTPWSEGFSRGIIWRGAVNASQLPPMQAAQNISQVFMGVNLKCASCHDSFVSDWTLADAYGMAAVYSDQTLELVHCDKPTGKIASPRFLYPQLGALPAGAGRPQRLKMLATLMTDRANGRLPRTIVNRLWARLMGRGLVEPLDDMDKPAWSPELLDYLAEDLVAHQYDLKHTLEVILASRAYQLPVAESTDPKAAYVFRGPLPRRLTAEQFCDAMTSLDGEWARLPATLQFDFAAGGMQSLQPPKWIWTDEPNDVGQQRVADQSAAHLALLKEFEQSLTPASAQRPATEPEADEEEAAKKTADKKNAPPRRHHVAFRASFELSELPTDAYAVVGASQLAYAFINGQEARLMMSERHCALYDIRPLLKPGINHIVLDVSSHTEKNNLNDAEKEKYPAALNHLNATPGVGFWMQAQFADGQTDQLVSDDAWQTARSPTGRWRDDPAYDASGWKRAVLLPPGVTPIDDGPAQEPITRKDFANEPIEIAPTFHTAQSTAANIRQPGNIRAALLAADPLMTALDRPTREQVVTTRLTAATTLQALALTNGSSLDTRLKRIAGHLAPKAAKDPAAFVQETYRHLLCREPSEAELKLSLEMIGSPAKPEGVADFLWGVCLLPEMQFIE